MVDTKLKVIQKGNKNEENLWVYNHTKIAVQVKKKKKNKEII